jgi:hypothetical protein
MALVVGTNSWVTVAEADTYLSEKWEAGTTWSGLTNAEKEAALITSYRWIKRKYPAIPAASTNVNVKNAQIELAWYIVNFNEEHVKRSALYTQGVRKFKISKWSETLMKSELPDGIDDLLEDFLTGQGNYFPTITRELNQGN